MQEMEKEYGLFIEAIKRSKVLVRMSFITPASNTEKEFHRVLNNLIVYLNFLQGTMQTSRRLYNLQVIEYLANEDL
jgi:hypothetical protein